MDTGNPEITLNNVASSVIVYSRNITRRPIAWDPARQRPTQEFIHSIHSALHFALDPCVNHPDELPSYALDVYEQGLSSHAHRTCLTIPSVYDMTSPHYDMSSSPQTTAKIFSGFGGMPLRVQDFKAALEATRLCTGFPGVHKLVVSMDGAKWAPGTLDVSQEDRSSLLPELLCVWEYLSSEPTIEQLGVSDFSPKLLSNFLDLIETSKLEHDHASPTDAKDPSPLHKSGQPVLKHPSINQLNFDFDLPIQVTNYAKKEGIALVSHSDDLGKIEQLINILREFKEMLPLPRAMKAANTETAISSFRLDWVLKYTVVLPDRGLVADKGYVMAATFTEQ